MRNSLVLTFSLLPILNISDFTGICATSISQEKCDFYQSMFQQPPSKDFPFLIRVYSGYYLNGNLIIENSSDFLNGIIISENFVLTIANNGPKSLLFVEFLTMQLEVIQKITNQQENIMLLRLSEPIKFNDQIRPVCLPQPQPQRITSSQIICWVDSSQLNHLKLKLAPRGSCKRNSVDDIKRIRVQGIYNGTSLCTNVIVGDRDKCNVPGSFLLNVRQKVVGIATDSPPGYPQTFVQLSEHVFWIEDIVWTSKSTSITTEVTSESADKTESSTTKIYAPVPSSPTAANTFSSNDTSKAVNEVILFLILCLSTILWSDGL